MISYPVEGGVFGKVDAEGHIVKTDRDVLLGRGEAANNHAGNKRFRDIVALHRSDYAAATKIRKADFAPKIVRAIRTANPSGRFLKKGEDGKWVDVGDKKAAKKASQALREKSTEARKAAKAAAAAAAAAQPNKDEDTPQVVLYPVEGGVFGKLDAKGRIVKTDQDILLGRGTATNENPGNKRFRDIVALHRPDYVAATKIRKPDVARKIVRAIRTADPPGRFLRKRKSGRWIDVGDKKAAEKASQALREKGTEARKAAKAAAAAAAAATVSAEAQHYSTLPDMGSGAHSASQEKESEINPPNPKRSKTSLPEEVHV